MPQVKSHRISDKHAVSILKPELIKPVPGRPIRIAIAAAATSGIFGVYAAASIPQASSSNALFEKTFDYPAPGTELEIEWDGPGAIVINPGISGHVSVSQA
jgi:hypothetical protein